MADEIATIEKLRDRTRNLWKELADVLGFEFKMERQHNDVIIQMLRATLESRSPKARELLFQISQNDRAVSDATRRIAECDWP